MSTAKFNQWLNSDGTENYKCRAWVNFNGTGTVAIRASGNVSSITDNGTGDYTVNFTTAMPDTNYATFTNNAEDYTNNVNGYIATSRARFAPTTTSTRVVTFVSSNGARSDVVEYSVAIFR